MTISITVELQNNSPTLFRCLASLDLRLLYSILEEFNLEKEVVGFVRTDVVVWN